MSVDEPSSTYHSSSSSVGSKCSVQPQEIAVYLQQPTAVCRLHSLVDLFTDVEPARFNSIKPENLRLSDDAWAALKLRVDPLARNILDPQRYNLAALGVGCLIGLVFYAIRPGFDRQRIQQRIGDDDDRPNDDDVQYDDYFQDDEWERKYHLDDIVLAEFEYFNAALERKILTWRIGLILVLVGLFGSVLFIAVLMERRNADIDNHITQAIQEIRPRVEAEGIGVEYRTRSRSSLPTHCFSLFAKYMRPTRVVVFYYLNNSETRHVSLSGDNLTNVNTKVNWTHHFFSEDYQQKYFPSTRRSTYSTTNIVNEALVPTTVAQSFSLV